MRIQTKRIFNALYTTMKDNKECDNSFLLDKCIQYLTSLHIKLLETGIAFRDGNRTQRRLFNSILRQTIKRTLPKD